MPRRVVNQRGKMRVRHCVLAVDVPGAYLPAAIEVARAAEVVTNGPTVALEPEPVIGLVRPDQARPCFRSRVVDRDPTADREIWQDLPRYHRIDAEICQLRLDRERAEARVLWPAKSQSERRINSQAVAEPGFVWRISKKELRDCLQVFLIIKAAPTR